MVRPLKKTLFLCVSSLIHLGLSDPYYKYLSQSETFKLPEVFCLSFYIYLQEKPRISFSFPKADFEKYSVFPEFETNGYPTCNMYGLPEYIYCLPLKCI